MNLKIKHKARINVVLTKMHKRRFFEACKFNGETVSDTLRGHMDKVIAKAAKDKEALKARLDAQKNDIEAENTHQGELNL